MASLSREDLHALAHVSDTGLLTLFGRALDSRTGGSIHDPLAENLAAALVPVLGQSNRPLHRRLAKGQIKALLGTYMGLRARHFDDKAVDFLARHPDAVIVNLGCGIDTRFHRLRLRLQAPALEVVDIDLPELIRVKQKVIAPEPGYRMVAGDVTQRAWFDELPPTRPLLFLAEGLLMYLHPQHAKALVLDLQQKAPGSELVAEVVRRRWLEGWRGRILGRKLQGGHSIDESAGFRFGITGPEEVESWAEGIKSLGEWSLFDESSPRLRGLRWMRRFDGLRRLQWVVHWQLGAPPHPRQSLDT